MKSFTRILLVISLFALCLMPAGGQQVSVSLSSSAAWSPGNWSRITIEITGAGGTGPCRFMQEYPAGFIARPVEGAGGELFLDDNSLNIVWAVFPAGRTTRVVYEVMPDMSLSGEIALGGIFYSVGRSNVRSSFELPVRKIVIGQGAGTSVVSGTIENDIVFRVQVLSSASRISDQELMKRLGVSFREKVTVIQSGNIFRYQVGECPTFECAQRINETLRKSGVEGSFIVAFRGNDPMPVEQARALQR